MFIYFELCFLVILSVICASDTELEGGVVNDSLLDSTETLASELTNNEQSQPIFRPTMNITYWSDYACPFCYIGEHRLRQALKELQLEDNALFEMRSFELDPNAPAENHEDSVTIMKNKYHLSQRESTQRVYYISKLGRDLGLDFKYETVVHTNTFNAHRLTKFVQSKGNAEDLDTVIEMLYDAYFGKNLNLSDWKVLADIAAEVDIPPKEVRALLRSKDFAGAVRQDEQEAYKRKIHSVPYFLINGKHPISGAISLQDMKKVLSAAEKEMSANITKKGAGCDENGCVFD